MEKKLVSFFNSRGLTLNQERQSKKKLLMRLSLARVITFSLGLIFLVFFSNKKDVILLFLSLSISSIAFTFLLIKSLKARGQLTRMDRLIEINFNEAKRVERRLDGLDEGSEYINPLHSFSGEIGIFGDFSIFQLVNRTCTKNGRDLLSRYLGLEEAIKNPGDRQKATKELIDDIDWRQEFEANKQKESLSKDINIFASLFSNFHPIKHQNLLCLTFIFPVFLFSTIIHAALVDFTYNHLIIGTIILLINGGINLYLSSRHFGLFQMAREYSCCLKNYSNLFRLIRKKSFSSPILNSIKEPLGACETMGIEQCIKKLCNSMDGLSNKGGLTSAIFLTDVFWVLKLAKWRKKYQSMDISRVFAAVNEMEVLVSIAGFAYINKGFTFPAIIEAAKLSIDAEEMGHPLIKEDSRIANDLQYGDKITSIILTGPNMSGKSTFLKALGVNIVLALAGAPVCAKKFRITRLHLFISMKITDNLKDNTSSFYAEIKRIEQLIELAEGCPKTFYIIDEIFRGTNSIDQIKGAISIIRHLKKSNAIGIISTHNSRLANYAAQDNTVKNMCFESSIDNGNIKFDYKLREGVAKNLTACRLIERIGIDTNIEIEDAIL